MLVSRSLLACLILLLALVAAPAFSLAAPINTNFSFSSGLTGWSADGDVAVVSGVTELTDPNGGGTLLQSTNTGPGSFVLTFDLFNGLAPKGNPGFPGNVFADLGAGTLYFSNSALTLTTLAGNSSTVLFDAASSGVVTTLSSVALGSGWFQYTLAFQTAFSYVTPVFDLFDQDFVANSILKIDNVKLEAAAAPVPEPATVILLAGAIPFIRRRIR
jgi:hypothetical protein